MSGHPHDRAMAAIQRAEDFEAEATARAERQMLGREPGPALVFQLYINLGNEAMWTAGDVSQALRMIANAVDNPRASAPFAFTDADGNLEAGYFQTIFDVNGNDVGRYAVKEKGA